MSRTWPCDPARSSLGAESGHTLLRGRPRLHDYAAAAIGAFEPRGRSFDVQFPDEPLENRQIHFAHHLGVLARHSLEGTVPEHDLATLVAGLEAPTPEHIHRRLQQAPPVGPATRQVSGLICHERARVATLLPKL